MPIVQAAGQASGSGSTGNGPTNIVEQAMTVATERYFETVKGAPDYNKLRDKKLSVRDVALQLIREGCDPGDVIERALTMVFPEE